MRMMWVCMFCNIYYFFFFGEHDEFFFLILLFFFVCKAGDESSVRFCFPANTDDEGGVYLA